MNRLNRRDGFTIVELLIVVVVIAILAAIVIVSYNGITQRSRDALVSNTLSSVSKKVKESAILNNELYPSSLDGIDISFPDGVDVTYAASPDFKQFCSQASMKGRAQFVTEDTSPQKGTCDGYVGVPGDGKVDAEGPLDAAVEVVANAGGFKLVTNENWSTYTLSWDAIPNTQRYNIQVKRDSGDWVYVNKASGSSIAVGSQTCATRESGTYSEYCTSQIASSESSVSFTNNHSKITAVDTVMQYRFRAVTASGNTEWKELSLAADKTKRTTVSGLSVKPTNADSFNSYSVSWNKVSRSNIPDPKVHIQVRKNGGNWLNVSQVNGSQIAVGSWKCTELDEFNSSAITMGSTCSYNIDPTLYTLSWSHAYSRPVVLADEVSYRIRLRSNTVLGWSSDWKEFSYTLPTVSKSVTGLKVEPVQADSFLNYQVSWNKVEGFGIPDPNVYIQVKKNDGEWENVNKTTGSNIATGSQYCRQINENSTFYKEYCSFTIDPSLTSLTWTNSYSRPVASTDVVKYRISVRSNSVIGFMSPWSEFTYSLPSKSSLKTPNGFNASLAGDASSVTLSWSNPSGMNIFNPNIQIQVKRASGEWENVNKTTGAAAATGVHYCRTINETSTFYKDLCSFTIEPQVTTVTWNNANVIPPVGQTYQYRIGYRSTSVLAYETNWVTASISR